MGLVKYRIAAALVLLLYSYFSADFAAAVDTITSTRYIKDPEGVVSAGNSFRLGFFSPVNSTNRYVGIWKSDDDPETRNAAWVANRNKPLNDSSGVVSIYNDGNLVVLNGEGEILWSSNVSGGVSNSSAQIRDDGNLVLSSSVNGGSIIWQSFQQPCDTLLPSMHLITNPNTGAKIQLTSWKSPSDPSTGKFSGFIDPSGISQFKILNGSQTYLRSGPWVGNSFVGFPGMESVSLNAFVLRREDDGSTTIRFSTGNSTLLVKFVLNSDGTFAQLRRGNERRSWEAVWKVPSQDCDIYGKCGVFGICNPQNSRICSCLSGFEPKNLDEWSARNWTSGCVRKELLRCDRENTGKVDGFLKMERMKVPDNAEWSPAYPEQTCRDECLNNCSCLAYAFYDGFGCMLWTENLTDIQQLPRGGMDLNIRLANGEFRKESNLVVIISVSVVAGLVTIVICVVLTRWLVAKNTEWKKKIKNGGTLLSRQVVSSDSERNMVGPNRLEELPLFKLGGRSGNNKAELQELPLFDLQKLVTATDDFALSNKLGQGGFGPVFKGKLADGQEIAVKRLSRMSGQGVEEFMNEVVVISKLQHRNLVRLLGCCVEGEEKMLVYEYLPNKSLDSFLFDPIKKEILDWKKRFNIVEGICRGLLYLHRDSRLKIIHRDLKASNILLDQELNPKISDFGLARIFGGNEDQESTNRVVGTYGYMSPEYAMEGRFSEKTDVFSLGVLLLEIVCSRKNTSFFNNQQAKSLLELAWNLWNEGDMLGLVDPVISDESFQDEILRCIHVGLLCVQEFAVDRPAVSTVISMLNSDILVLPIPKKPAFVGNPNGLNTDPTQLPMETDSVGGVTMTDIHGR